MAKNDLSVGTKSIFYAIKSRYPALSDSEARQLTSVVLDEVAKRIGSGDELAFFRMHEDGQAEMITYALERKDKK